MMRRGFSIVELMVTIGVIALLVGLLAPALSTVKARTRSTECQMNLRQMAIAAQNYAAVFTTFPLAVQYKRVDGRLHEINWDWVNPFGRDELIGPGPLWMYTDNPDRVQQCTEYFGPSRSLGDPYTGYNYNTSYVGGEALFSPPHFKSVRPGIPPHACRRGEHCAMFGDGGSKNGANKFMRAPMRPEGGSISVQITYNGGQAFRHMNQTNIAFVDGHIGSSESPHRGNLSTDELLNDVMGFPENGFLSDDDSAYDPR